MGSNLKVGITGGIGSGKTTVCRIFKILGIPVYDADSRARDILNNDPDLRIEIIRFFGSESYSDIGFNNQWMARHVFTNEENLQLLNNLVHPRVGKDFDLWADQIDTSLYLIKEAALLYESGSYQGLDKIVVVTAPESIRVARVLDRDSHRTEDQIKAILRRQWPEENKIEKADYLIVNDDRQLVIPQVLQLHRELLDLSSA